MFISLKRSEGRRISAIMEEVESSVTMDHIMEKFDPSKLSRQTEMS